MVKTRRFEKRKPDDIIRRCKLCMITDNELPFLIQKNVKNGRFYKHCICKACYEQREQDRRREYYASHRDAQIKAATDWNTINRERYNANRRKSFREKFYPAKLVETFKQVRDSIDGAHACAGVSNSAFHGSSRRG